jgi:hypothetical protein
MMQLEIAQGKGRGASLKPAQFAPTGIGPFNSAVKTEN